MNCFKDMAIYGVVNGKAYQAAVLEETSKHQISWQLDHEQSGAQTFNVHIYDEDGYAAYRKVFFFQFLLCCTSSQPYQSSATALLFLRSCARFVFASFAIMINPSLIVVFFILIAIVERLELSGFSFTLRNVSGGTT